MSAHRSPRRDPEATRIALVTHAIAQFTAHGYEATSLDAVVAGLGVTKGALYHHFAGKRELFAAAFEQVENDFIAQTRSAASTQSGEERTLSGLRHFLAGVRDPAFRQIVMIDGPAVLGWTAQDPAQRPSFPSMVRTLERILEPGWDIGSATLEMLARMLFAVTVTAAAAVAAAPDSATAEAMSDEAERAVLLCLAALRDVSRTYPDADSAITASLTV